ncbi:tetratricopeptide repeat protein [Pseudomonas sp. EA_35y_Pfl2_R111]|uniref:tetratricopeptide repeat protein n=1 Tax=Pseudomonas sp. EA_35y_Pfl2_R111 TaxID=3088689 RepID=UPI0030DDDB6F
MPLPEEVLMVTDNIPMEQSRLSRLLSFLEHDPHNLTLLLDAMSLVIETVDLVGAQQLLNHIDTHAIDDPHVYAQATYLLLQVGAYAKAGAFGDKAIQAGITHPAVIFNTAFGHFYGGEYSDAGNLLARLTASADCSVATLMMHARALHHQELTEEAELLVSRAQQQEPSNIEARGLLALLQYENDDNLSALRTAHETLADDPNQLDALIACASANFEQGSLEASRKAWLHTVNAHPDCGRAWSGLAQLEFNGLEFNQAEEHLKLAVQFMPDHIGTWHLLAWIYILRNDSAAAREALNKSYDLDRNFGETHGGLAIVDVMDGKDDQARLGIRRAHKLNPNGLSAHYAEMLMLQKAGKSAEATQLVNQVLDSTAPDGHESGRTLVELWLRKHQDKRPEIAPGQH